MHGNKKIERFNIQAGSFWDSQEETVQQAQQNTPTQETQEDIDDIGRRMFGAPDLDDIAHRMFHN